MERKATDPPEETRTKLIEGIKLVEEASVEVALHYGCDKDTADLYGKAILTAILRAGIESIPGKRTKNPFHNWPH